MTPSGKLFLVTNSNNITLPNLINYSRNDLEVLFKFLNIPYLITGNGYVTNQSIPPKTIITPEMEVEVVLTNKVKIDE